MDRDDVDVIGGALTVRDSKCGKSREVLLHPTTVMALERYCEIRDRLCPHPPPPPDRHASRQITRISNMSTRLRTFWYLSAAPELLGLAADRLEHATGGRR